MSFDAVNLFNKLQEQEQRASNNAGFAVNTLILKPKIGCNYSLRLLWLQPEGTCNREYPMINQYIHHYWDDQAIGPKDQVVYCPTSQYIKGESKEAFNICPICTECSKLYKASQEGSSSAEKLYKTFRRTFRGFIPVYVVNGPDDVVGQVKILQYGKQFKDFFDRKIFGVVPKKDDNQPVNADEIIGLDAFLYVDNKGKVITEGYNFNIQVTSKKMVIEGRSVEMPQYTLDFSRRVSSITSFGDREVTAEVLAGLNAEISYDNDFYNTSSAAELNKFKIKYLAAEDAVASNEEEDTIDKSVSTAASKINPFAKKESKAEPVKESVEEPKNEEKTSENKSEEDIDIDSLISGL